MDIDIFLELPNYDKYFVDQLILSSTLLGLLIATSTFLLQSGFTNFEFSRSMFLKYYITMTKVLFLLLGYNIIVPLIFLYTDLNSKVVLTLHFIYSLLFIKYLLDFYSHKGYILTINSNKFNPYKNSFLKYVRFITNLGLIHIILILFFIFVVTIYPLLPATELDFTDRQAFIATIIAFAFSVLSLIRIIPQYFSFTEIEYKHKENTELKKDIEVDVSKELGILKDILIKYGRNELENQKQFGDLGKIDVRLVDKKDEAFFVINLNIHSSNIYAIVSAIENYTYEFFKDLKNTNVDINSFVLSYFVKIESVPNSKTYFVRSKRVELERLISETSDSKEFVRRIENKVIDDLFRGV